MALLKDGTRIYGTLYANTEVVIGSMNVASQINAAYLKANTANILAQDAFNHANSVNTVTQSAYNQANSASVLAAAAFSTANTDVTSISLVGSSVGSSTQIPVIGYAANGRIISAGVASPQIGTGSVKGIIQLNDSISSTLGTSGANAATPLAVKTTYDYAQSSFDKANSVDILAQAAFDKANTASAASIDQFARDTANTAASNTVYLQTINDTQNTNISSVTTYTISSYDKANSANVLAQAAYDKANTAASSSVDQLARDTANSASSNTVYLQTINDTQNTNITTLQGVNESQNTRLTSVEGLAGQAYNRANDAFTQANVGATFVTTGGTVSGNVTFTKDITISGNLSVLGNSTTINTNQLDVYDSLIYLANNNLTTDAVDIGIIGRYKGDSVSEHSGIFRDPNLKEWIIFKGYTPQIQSNNLIDINDASFQHANVFVDYVKGNLIGSSATINGLNLYDHTTSAFDKANAVGVLTQSAYNVANTATTNITALQGVDETQNTNITNVNTLTSSSYNQANAASVLAQASFDKANTDVTNISLAGSSVGSSTQIPVIGYAANGRIISAGVASPQVGTGSVRGITQLNDSVTSTSGVSGANAATPLAVKTAYDYAQSSFDKANSANVLAQTSYDFAQNSFNKANSANVLAQAAYDAANSAISGSIDQYARDTANTASANTVYLQTINDTQNTNITSINTYSFSSYSKANSAATLSQSAYDTVNSVSILTQSSYDKVNSVSILTQSAYNTANLKFNTTGGTITGNVEITGNLIVTGNINFTSNVNSISGNSGQFFGDVNGFGALYAGIPVGFYQQPQTTIQATSDYNGYSQINIQNINTGNQSSGDLIITADNGAFDEGYTDIGMASSTYDYPGFGLIHPNDGYFLVHGNTTTSGGNVVIATALNNDIVFAVNGVDHVNEILRLSRDHEATLNANLIIQGSNVALGNIQNIHIYGGASGRVVITDGSGNLSFSDNLIDAWNTANTSSSNTVYLQTVNNIQNTNITNVNTLSSSAYDKANSANVLAQAAFDKANTSSGPSGSDTQVQFNDGGSSFGADSTFAFNKTSKILSVQQIAVTNSSGDEGGEILLAKPATNTTLDGTGVTVDVYQNKLRFFEQGGSARGFYLDISTGGGGASTNIMSGGGGSTNIDQYARDTANSASSNTIYLQSINNTQNTDITTISTVSSNAYDKANSANVLAQAAFDKANTGSTDINSFNPFLLAGM
jgi:hypothetical protein